MTLEEVLKKQEEGLVKRCHLCCCNRYLEWNTITESWWVLQDNGALTSTQILYNGTDLDKAIDILWNGKEQDNVQAVRRPYR